MRLILLLTILLTLTAKSVQAEEPATIFYRSSQAALVVGNAIDLGGSTYAIAKGNGVEQNLWLARFKQPVLFATVKTGTAVLTLWLTDKIPNRKVAAFANFGIGAFFGGLGIHAERIAARGK